MVGSLQRTLSAVAFGWFAVMLAGCSGDATQGGPPALQGAGATFPAPLYSVWFKEYGKLAAGRSVDYKAVGSGQGAIRFLSGEVDFGASDVPLTDEQIASAPYGAILIPTTAAPIAIAYRVAGVPDGLRLSRDLYVDLFLGKIAKWNDPRLAKANPGLKLPDLSVTLAVRSDRSGTTYAMTQHLAAVSPEWKNGPGVGDRVKFPGKVLDADGNSGVARLIQTTPGAIGYIVLRDARGAGLSTARLENHEGEYVMPSEKSGGAAVAAAVFDARLRTETPDPKGRDAYPIVTFTWLLLPYKLADREKAQALRALGKWCLTDGQDLSERNDFVPLSKEVAQAALKLLDEPVAP